MEFYEHGGQRKCPEIQYDFSANINSLGLPAGVSECLQTAAWRIIHYPDGDCTQLRYFIAANWMGRQEEIVCTNGASEAIYGLVRACAPKQGIVMAPAFSEYERALQAAGVPIRFYELNRKNNFVLTEDFLDFLEGQEQNSLLFLCNPNNPTGSCIRREFLLQILELAQRKQIWVAVDECFLPFLKSYTDYSLKDSYQSYDRLLLIQAFTKIYAMPGLRLGFAVSSNKALLQRLKEQLPAWNVSVTAQEAGCVALEEKDYLQKTRQWLYEERIFLQKELSACKSLIQKVYPADANFLFFESVPFLEEALKKYGIGIRSCENYRGLKKGDYRIAVRTHKENLYLLGALQKCGLEAHDSSIR